MPGPHASATAAQTNIWRQFNDLHHDRSLGLSTLCGVSADGSGVRRGPPADRRAPVLLAEEPGHDRFAGGEELVDRLNCLICVDAEGVDELRERSPLTLCPPNGSRAGERFDPSLSGRDAAFGGHHKGADVACGANVCPSTQLHAETRDGHDSYP